MNQPLYHCYAGTQIRENIAAARESRPPVPAIGFAPLRPRQPATAARGGTNPPGCSVFRFRKISCALFVPHALCVKSAVLDLRPLLSLPGPLISKSGQLGRRRRTRYLGRHDGSARNRARNWGCWPTADSADRAGVARLLIASSMAFRAAAMASLSRRAQYIRRA